MTTTVHIHTSGNKRVKISTPSGEFLLQPGGATCFSIHGEQVLSIAEEGDFITPPVLVEKVAQSVAAA